MIGLVRSRLSWRMNRDHPCQISRRLLVSSSSSSMQHSKKASYWNSNWTFMCEFRFSRTIEFRAKSFLYFMTPAQPPRRLRLTVQTPARFRKAILHPTRSKLYLHFTLYRSRKIYLSAHLFSIGERPWAEMESSENFSREQNRARKRIATENCKNSERLEFILACNPSSFRYRIFLLAKQQQKFLQNILFQQFICNIDPGFFISLMNYGKILQKSVIAS